MAKQNRKSEQEMSKTSVIGKETNINGDFSTEENLRIDGQIIGNVNCGKRLVIGVSGKVEGDVKASEVFIEGHLIGETHCSGHIEIKSTAVVEGKVFAKTIAIEENASFNGKLRMEIMN